MLDIEKRTYIPQSNEENKRDKTPIPIYRGGGKLESTRALAEKGFPVPKSHYLYYSDLQNQSLVTATFRDIPKPLIVRGSHINDWHGYIDILPTFRSVKTEEGLIRAIKKIQEIAGSNEVRKHAEDWNQTFSTEVHVLVQEQSPSTISGSMLRHPHKLDEIHANYVDRELRETYGFFQERQNFSSATIFDDGQINHYNWAEGINEEQIVEAGVIYKAVEQSGLIDPEWVYQMEMGLDPFMIYQLRPFKRKEPVKKFDIPNTQDVKYPCINSDLVFGITPPEGIKIHFEEAYFNEVYHNNFNAPEDKPYGLRLRDYSKRSLPTDIMLRNMIAVLSRNSKHEYLEHGDYRLLKKSQYGLLHYRDHNVDDVNLFQDSILWSNGEKGVLIPTQYVSQDYNLTTQP